ncbi:putative quinol monooxygenase [Deinococcus sp. UYEF24]
MTDSAPKNSIQNNMAVNVQAVIVPKPEHVQDVEREMLAMVTASRQEEGCFVYDLLKDEQEGPGQVKTVRFHVQERYRDMDAVKAHQGSDHYQAYRAKAGGWFASAPQVTVLHDVDVEQK